MNSSSKSRINLFAIISGVIFLLAAFIPNAEAVPGDLDTTFSTDGVVTYNGGFGNERKHIDSLRAKHM